MMKVGLPSLGFHAGGEGGGGVLGRTASWNRATASRRSKEAISKFMQFFRLQNKRNDFHLTT